MVFAGSLQLIRTAQLVRSDRYWELALANFTQGAGLGGSQFLLGLARPSGLMLVGGFLLSRAVWAPSLKLLVSTSFRDFRKLALKHRSYALAAGTTAFVNGLGSQLPVLAAAAFFGSVEAGLFAMMARILISPLTVVGQAAAAATLGHIGMRLRARDERALRLLNQTMRDLFLVGLVPCIAVAIGGPWGAEILLGSEWKQVGILMSVMSIGALAQFTCAPFAQLLNLMNRSRTLLLWDITRLAIVTLAISIPALMGWPFVVSVALLSFGYVIIYIALSVMVRSAIIRGVVGRQD